MQQRPEPADDQRAGRSGSGCVRSGWEASCLLRSSRRGPSSTTGSIDRSGPSVWQKPCLRQVVGDLLRGDLQAEEGVDAGEVAAQRGRARGVQAARARCACRAPRRCARRPGGRSGLRPAPPWSSRSASTRCSRDVGLQPGAVDDAVDLRPRGPVAVLSCTCTVPCGPRLHVVDLALVTVRYQPSCRPRRICACQSLRYGRVGAADQPCRARPGPRLPACASGP